MSNDTFYIAATGLRTQERALSLTAGNITNMNTAGYKRTQVRYAELVSPSLSPDGLVVQTGARSAGVSLAGTTTVLTPGDLRATGSAMDLAIEGDGFIELLGPDGQSLLWRGGTLTVGPDGLLSTLDGHPLRALIQVPDDLTNLSITRDGTVWGQSADSQSPVELGRIDLVLPSRPETLIRSEGGYYAVSPEQRLDLSVPGEGRAGGLVQGALEASNVVLAEEMVTLMLVQRAFAASAQALQAGDQLMAIANGLRR